MDVVERYLESEKRELMDRRSEILPYGTACPPPIHHRDHDHGLLSTMATIAISHHHGSTIAINSGGNSISMSRVLSWQNEESA